MAELLLLRGAMGAGKTSTAAKLRERSPQLVIIEIDDIKIRKYGTTEKCDPAVDFKEAGAQAKVAMESGKDVVVIEPLCEQQDIDFVLDGAALSKESLHIASVWLHCSLEIAIVRKGQSHETSVIESQHRRYASRVRLKNEVIIHTDTISVDEVVAQLQTIFGATSLEESS